MAVALLVPVEITRAERVNRSASAGLVWSSAKEEGDLVNKVEADESAALLNEDEFDGGGGFSSLDGMLQWAIGHSDPAKLQVQAQDIQQLSIDELKKRQTEVKELMEKLKMPSDAELMQIAISDLNNSSMPVEDHHRALEELLMLVEPIDNANDLYKLGGLEIVVEKLGNLDPGIRTSSAWVIGKASQNNPLVQKQVLELGALVKLMMMVKSGNTEEAIKALYAVSTLIRNNLYGQELFFAEGGDLMLQEILSNSGGDIRLRKKSVFLVADLTEGQSEARDRVELASFSNCFFLKSVVDLTLSNDLDLQEKALYAIKNLLLLRSTEAVVLKDFCSLDGALERMMQQFQQLMLEEDHREYVIDVESLRREVELIFLEKLNKVAQVPT